MNRISLHPFAFLCLFAAVTLGLTGCEENEGASLDENAAPLTIGAFYNLSGAQAGLDVPSSLGARLAVQEVNRAGGLNGRSVKMILEDGQSNPDIIKKKAAELIKNTPQVAALMGFSDTDMVLAAARIAADNKRVFLTSGATSPLLPAEIPEYLFLACFGDNVQAAAAAQWAYERHSARTALVLFDKSMAYTRLLKDYFISSFTALGGKVLSVQPFAQGHVADITGDLKKADLIFFSAGPGEVVAGVRALRKAGITAPILGGDSYDLGDAWGKYPDISNVYFTTHVYLKQNNPSPQMADFLEKYARAYPGKEADAFSALGFDAANLLMQAMTRAKDDGSGPGPRDLREALGAVRAFKGVTGTIGYPPGSRIPTKSVTILKVEGGKVEMVEELRPQMVPPP